MDGEDQVRLALDILKKKRKDLVSPINEQFEILLYMSNSIAKQVNGKEIVLKGGLALMDRVQQANPALSRMTTDLDLYVQSDEVYNKVFSNILDVLNSNKCGLTFDQTKHRDRSVDGRSESFKFKVTCSDGKQHNVSIDLQVGQRGLINVIPGIRTELPTYDNYTMLADKVSVACSDKIFRRTKDLYDIYVLSQLQDYDMEAMVKAIIGKRPEFVDNAVIMFTPTCLRKMEHGYNRFEGIVNKPKFEEIYKVASNFVVPIALQVNGIGNYDKWIGGGSSWRHVMI